jgi:hypothetical protein
VLVQTLGEVGIDPRGDEVLDSVGLRLLERAADIILGYPDLGNLVFIEQRLEAAVRDRRQLGALQIQVLN